MKKWEKRSIGNAVRWGMLAAIGLTIAAAALICRLVPYKEILKYADGNFFCCIPREEYSWIFGLIWLMTVIGVLFSFVWEIALTEQRIKQKIARIAVSLLLCFAETFVTFICALFMTGLFPEWNIPSAWEKYTIGGKTLVLAGKPQGMHHIYPALYEVNGDDVRCIGSGEDIEGRTDDFRVTAAENGYTVTYIETINGERVMKSFTAERKELSE